MDVRSDSFMRKTVKLQHNVTVTLSEIIIILFHFVRRTCLKPREIVKILREELGINTSPGVVRVVLYRMKRKGILIHNTTLHCYSLAKDKEKDIEILLGRYGLLLSSDDSSAERR